MEKSNNKLPPINANSNPSGPQSSINGSSFNHKSLSILKKSRKQAEEDAKLLANRIALLKQEEIKTQKKIEETKAKALEIYKLKLKNEEKLNNKVYSFLLSLHSLFSRRRP